MEVKYSRGQINQDDVRVFVGVFGLLMRNYGGGGSDKK